MLEVKPWHNWYPIRFKYSVTSGRSGGTLIKGEMSDRAGDGLYPGFSASGQDVWVETAHYRNAFGIVVSAVGARCGKCFRADGDWTAIANTMVLIPRSGFDRDYLWYIFNDEEFWDKGGTAQPYIRFSESLYKEWRFPSHEEQIRIAKFLDRETAEADALVAKYERLIELLEEKRVALITQAVTKGLDPSAPMKESGIPYIGWIPSHWNVPAVWMIFSIGRGRVLSHDDIRNNPGDYPVYSSQTENNGEMGRIGTFDFDGSYLTWTTDGANAGTVFVRSGKFNCTNVCGTLKPISVLSNLGYFQNALSVLTKAYVRLDINPKLMNDVMSRIRLPQPPENEQAAIQRFLDGELRPIAEMREKLRRSIDLVNEHRSALITAAVTGQIDVNTYRSKKPKEVPA